MIPPFYWADLLTFPGREKIWKICEISGEKLVFSPQISYIILRSNAVNAVKLCKFTARVSGELTKIHNISALSTSYFPCTVSNLSPLVLPLRDFSLNSRIFVLNLNQIHSPLCKTYELSFSKISGEIANFSDEMCWMRWIYVSSSLILVVKLHRFTA